MDSLLERSRYLAVIASLGLLVGSAVTFGWGVHGIYEYIRALIDGDEDLALVEVLATIDVFLLATVLLVIAIGLWELFVSDLDVPDWLEISSLDDLKKKLADVLVLVIAIKALEKFTTAKSPDDALQYALAAALIVAALSINSLVKMVKERGGGAK